jgi:hypothetical protein
MKIWISSQKLNYEEQPYLFTAYDNGRYSKLHSYDVSHYFGDVSEEYLDVRISSSLLVTIFSTTPTDLATATLEDTNAMLKQAKDRGHKIITKLLVYDLNKTSR